MMQPLYYESRIIIEPVFEARCSGFRELCESNSFAGDHTYCTSRSTDLDDIVARTKRMVKDCDIYGFVVQKFSIEAVLVESDLT
jgi:hypothetical protein